MYGGVTGKAGDRLPMSIDAPPGLIRSIGREVGVTGQLAGLTQARQEKERPSLGQTEGVGVLSYSVILSHRRIICGHPSIVFVLEKGTSGCKRFGSVSNISRRETNLSLTYFHDY